MCEAKKVKHDDLTQYHVLHCWTIVWDAMSIGLPCLCGQTGEQCVSSGQSLCSNRCWIEANVHSRSAAQLLQQWACWLPINRHFWMPLWMCLPGQWQLLRAQWPTVFLLKWCELSIFTLPHHIWPPTRQIAAQAQLSAHSPVNSVSLVRALQWRVNGPHANVE